LTTAIGDVVRQRRVCVVGGGLAGLTAAAVAAGRGAEVVVFEARETVGGRARSRVREGVVFNQGPHGLNPRHGAVEVFAELGISVRGSQPRLGGACGRLRGVIGLLPGTPADAIRSRLVGPRAKLQLGRAFARPARLLETELLGVSLQQWIDIRFSNDDARAIAMMTGRLTTYIDDLSTLDATAGVHQIVAALSDGVLYLDGGWQQLVDALRDAAEQWGAKIVTDRKIEAIDEVDTCDAIVLALGGPQHVARFLDGKSRCANSWTPAAPVMAASLDVALSKLPYPERRACMGVDDPIYCSVHTPAALAPAGVEVLHVLRYGDPDTDPRAELEAFLDDAQPGWRHEVIDEQYGRRLTVSHDRPRPATGLRGRPAVEVADVDGLYIAGDWVGPAGLLADAAVLSGHAAGIAAAAS